MLEINRKKEILDRCSKWQLVQVEIRWCLVFPACMSASFLLPSFSRKGFIYQACCQCFSYVFNIRKIYLGLLCLKFLDCSMHFSEKTKGVRESAVLPQVSPVSITFGSLFVFPFCSQMLSSIAHHCSHAVWFRLLFLQIKNEVICIVLWNLGFQYCAGQYYSAMQSYLSCRCFSRGLSGEMLTLKIHLNE